MQKDKNKPNIDVIILAAGASSRLGQPKQLLPYGGTTLLQHTIQVAVDSIANLVIVVLGAHEEQIRKAIEPQAAQIVINSEWQEGMASTIRCGISALLRSDPQTDGVVLMLCDQPFVTAVLLNELIATWQNTDKHIVACSYNGTIGVPALFHKNIFPELLQLKGDVGARAVIQRHIADVEVVLFSRGSVDIDTLRDFLNLE